ncbi:RagB/SusD family nutrient uptake outer membrane protein [Pontibacter sp. SGAir0037]|uniref:RagB/SusD family nutrient uptake outer membrane protein n=1 Tax=Pontibacter sp. SGAir0037 TaxID=2571030 RepID=UPI0010CD640D|nr:RagB/SusD family nutrient uptake outer membrane protein [Pontibacter sp. SGAir0037]QCR23296.1 RagB/SusD family nutrient uptake outer membrane protein [Pontibacter sp. SGAir0037]
MKLKNILYPALLLSGITVFSSCDREFLELQPRGTELEGNFYQNEEQVYQGLIAVYDVMQWGTSGGYTMKMPLLTVASDEAHAGGSDAADQPSWVRWDNFTVNPFDSPAPGLWQKSYTGIYRANLLLEKIETAPLSQAFKDRVIAETKTLRAYFYFDLVRYFGNVPLITATIPTNQLYSLEQSAPSVIFGQIEQDLNDAIPNLPATIPSGQRGRLSRYAALAILGKAIMHQNNNARMAEAAQIFNRVNTEGGYQLLQNYGDIFRPDNKFHSESILEIPHSNLAAWGDWGWVNGGEGNVAPQFIGIADYNGPTYSGGWGFAPISLSLVNALQGDPRFEHTIIDGKALKENGATYSARYQNTDYFIKKYAPISAYRSSVGTPELNWPINEIEIRLADTYLLEAEALVRSGGNTNRAKDLLDAVRGRVGLPSVAPTLDNIYRERQLELATEGHRFFDLVRTGRAATVLGPLGFQTGKHEWLPIPQQEIDITKGTLKQNPGYN